MLPKNFGKFDETVCMKKKSKEEIKKELHKLIDSIDDDYTLNVLNEDIVPYAVKNRTKKQDEQDDLTEEQQRGLDEAIKQVEEGKVVGWDEYLKATARWRTK